MTRELPRPLTSGWGRDDAVAVARALDRAGMRQVSLIAFPDETYVLAEPSADAGVLDPWAEEPDGLDVPRWIGVIPYECRRTLERSAWVEADLRPAPPMTTPRWLRYDAGLRLGVGGLEAWGDDARVADLERALADDRRTPSGAERLAVQVVDADEPSAHIARIRRAQELIRAGDLYQVNLARRLDLSLTGDPLTLYARMAALAAPRYGAYLDMGDSQVVATSPELLMSLDARHIASEPIKGTRPRDSDPEVLDADPKERAELAMIVDVVLNDLRRVARPGSTRMAAPPHVRGCGPVWHRLANLVAERDVARSRAEIFESLIPSGSVTGAPKIRAMEVIRELEAHRRGLYTGAYGFVCGSGRTVLAMAIRTAVLSGGHGHYFTGGGIVLGSDAERELAETRWKATQLLSLAS